MTALATLAAITLDCSDVKKMSDFYSQALDFKVIWSDDNVAYLQGADTIRLGLQRVDGYTAPSWPTQQVPQQSHLDLSVQDVAVAEAEMVKLGATVATEQPGADRWRVLLDPDGHPFCLTALV
jgi:catechol 2,3-dioxygenase-like lactoylglutathione lyase family enzyme